MYHCEGCKVLDSPPQLVMVKLRLASHHLLLLCILVLLAPNSSKHIQLLANSTSD